METRRGAWKQAQWAQLGLARLTRGNEFNVYKVVHDFIRNQPEREKGEELASLCQSAINVPQHLPVLAAAAESSRCTAACWAAH